MIITVDTEKDSNERLLEVARFLEQLAGKSSVPYVQAEAEPSAEMFDLFSAPAEPSPAPKPKPASRLKEDETVSVLSQLLKDDEPKVRPY